jgi:excisionase family DNA binding protein
MKGGFMVEEILTKEELASYLKVTERTIDRLRKKGMPFFKVGDTVRFKKDAVLKWLEENSQEEQK